MSDAVLKVEDLRTAFLTRERDFPVVDGVSIRVDAGQIVGLVGESGCGKTMLALSILRLVPQPGRVTSGRVLLSGRDLLKMDDEALRRVRGRAVAMTFQDPMTSLNPLMRVRDQIWEAMATHDRFSTKEAAGRVVPLMRSVHVPAAEERGGAYPHQFSGGMRQRVLIAMGISNEPELLIADEPTTALDVSTQAQIVRLLKRLNRDLSSAMLLITHNMALVATLCERVVVMYAGRVVEEGPVQAVFDNPQHPYTWGLLRSLPRLHATATHGLLSIPGQPPNANDLPSGCKFHPRCPFRKERCLEEEPPLGEVEDGQRARCWVLMRNVPEGQVAQQAWGRASVVTTTAPQHGESPAHEEVFVRLEDVCKYFPAGGQRRLIRAVDGVSLDLRRGETLGLVGESGCGKSTLAQVIAQLAPATSGRVLFEGLDLSQVGARKLRQVRRHMQVIFQDPFSSLDPRMTVSESVSEPLDNYQVGDRRQRRRRVQELLEIVGLEQSFARRYPHQLSGGQRQRVGIARALALNPSLIVCDEPVSALDASIQAQIVNLLADLQQEFQLTYLFISHDLGIVRHLAHRVAVMYLGKIVELGATAEVYSGPQHPYAKMLLESILVAKPPVPVAAMGAVLTGEVPSPLSLPRACRFHTRCPLASVPGVCDDVEPPLVEHGHRGHSAACHFADKVTSATRTAPTSSADAPAQEAVRDDIDR